MRFATGTTEIHVKVLRASQYAHAMPFQLHERSESHQCEQGDDASFVGLGPINRVFWIPIRIEVNDLAVVVAILAKYPL